MAIYLPIAEVSVNLFLLLGLGGMVGILSGMFGVGGGFILTPFLFFIGIPPAVAVATGANQIVASSVSGVPVGFLSAIMGVGGGFIMVPAMIYVLGMPTKVVVGTSLFQIIFVAAFTTAMHAIESQTVDVVLALALILSGVVGAQIGAELGLLLKAEHLRILLALMVLAVCVKLGLWLVLMPPETYSLVR